MILQTAGRSPSQKASLEDKAGCTLQGAENLALCGGVVETRERDAAPECSTADALPAFTSGPQPTAHVH